MKKIKILMILLILLIPFFGKGGEIQVFGYNDSWKFKWDNTCLTGSSWKSPLYNDLFWSEGGAPIGYIGSLNYGLNPDGDDDLTTRVVTTLSPYNPTYYLRKNFIVNNKNQFTSFTLKFKRNNGVIIYVNGTQVFKDSNLPQGDVSCSQLITSPNEDLSTEQSLTIDKNLLFDGINTISVELHNRISGEKSSTNNVWWVAKLNGNTTTTIPVIVKGAYLMMPIRNGINAGTITNSSSTTIQWETDIPSVGYLKISPDPTLNTGVSTYQETTSKTRHAIVVNNLNLKTKYYYGVFDINGTNITQLQFDPLTNYFYTAPQSDSTLRFWVTGDVGNANAVQSGMKSAFLNYCVANNVSPINGWIWLGDNAYNSGLAADYQSQTFTPFANELKHFPLLPSPGNHDYANLGYPQPSNNSIEYFNLMAISGQDTLTSQTKKYWSHNYGPIHFISLDSYGALSDNLTTPMLTWLNNDLATTFSNTGIVFIVAFWHHPPYSMGTHNTDNAATSASDRPELYFRNNVLPILEKYGVDLVLCGHSHVYERSKFIKGHYAYNNSVPNDPRASAVGKSNPATGLENDFLPNSETLDNTLVSYGYYPSSNEVANTGTGTTYIKSFPRSFTNSLTTNGTIYSVVGCTSPTDGIVSVFGANHTAGGNAINPYTVTSKQISGGIATLILSRTFTGGNRITVSGVDATFNGTYIITGYSGAQITYAKPGASNVPLTTVNSTTAIAVTNKGWPHDAMAYSQCGDYPGGNTQTNTNGGSVLLTMNRRGSNPAITGYYYYFDLNMKYIQNNGNGGSNNFNVLDDFTITKAVRIKIPLY